MQTKLDPQFQLQLYGVASCLGAQDQGCYSAPQKLLHSDLLTSLRQKDISAQWRKILAFENTNSSSLSELYQHLAEQIKTSTINHLPFLVIGGDHSCAIGTWSGAAMGLRQQSKESDLGLIWVDAHMDAHTNATSPSGALHGMPVACLLGHGEPQYCNIAYNGQKIKPKNLCLIGIRSYEKEEEKLLRLAGVKIYYIEDVRKQGLDAILQKAVTRVTQDTIGFGISIDMDAIDPRDAPGVGSPEINGIHSQTLLAALLGFANMATDTSSRFIGAEITELNPERDIDHKTQTLVTNIIHSIFGDS